MKRILAAVFMLLLFTAVNGFTLLITETGFPYKGFVYESLKIPPTEWKNVQVDKHTYFDYHITYNGKKYKATLFKHGAIYLEREGQNPVLISFDVREFRWNGRTRF